MSNKVWIKFRRGFADEGYHLAEPFVWDMNPDLKCYRVCRDDLLGEKISNALAEDLALLSKEEVVKLKLKGVIV
jgi:hypothetical protein